MSAFGSPLYVLENIWKIVSEIDTKQKLESFLTKGKVVKFEYADLYRFLVSAGIVLLALSFLAPWLLLREPLDVLYSASDQELLTDISRELLLRKQDTLLRVLAFIPVFSVALIILGGFLATYGGWGWFKLQKIRDKKEAIGLAREEHELVSMTAAEKEEKMQSEITEVFDDSAVTADQSTFMKSYEAVESQIAKRINDVKGTTHNVLRNRRAGRSFIDILVEPKSETGSISLEKHYLIEVKVRRRIQGYLDLKSSFLQLQKAVSDYRSSTNVLPNSKLIIVVQEYSDNNERVDRLIEKLEAEFKQSGKHNVVVIPEAELDKISDAQFSRIVGL